MPLRYLSIPICSLCRFLDSLVTVHKVLNAFEISKYTHLFFMSVSYFTGNDSQGFECL